MMKKYNKVFLTVGYLLATQLYAADIPKGAMIEIESCSKVNWCKLDKKDLYVEKRYVKHLRGKLYRNRDDDTFLYKKRTGDNHELFNYIKKHQEYNNVNNFIHGYIRVKDIQDFATHNNLNSKTTIVQQEQKEEPNSNFFVFAGLGTSISNITKDTNVAINPDTLHYLFDLGVGYNFNKTYFTTLSVQRATNDDEDITDLLLSANYRFKDLYLTPYIGLVAGAGQLEWKNISTDSTQDDLKSSRYFLGLQAGAAYKLTDNFSLYGQYQYLPVSYMAHTPQGELEYSRLHNLTLGVKYDIK